MDILVAPFVVPGYEPTPDGPRTAEARKDILMGIKQQRLVQAGIESPAAKSLMSAGMGEQTTFIFLKLIYPL
jgi:hypothetical protein